MMGISFGPNLDFFNFDFSLLFLGLALAPPFIILKLAKIHNPTHRRFGTWRNLYKIEVFVLGSIEGFVKRHNANVVVGFGNQANFARTYLSIDTVSRA